jgi:amino acid adenylation domain-containing protein
MDKHAERHPDRSAVRCRTQTLTYGELADRSDRLSGVLRQTGASRMDRIGILLPKCIETAVAVYGILKAGCAYVPLDPATPAERIQSTIRDCGIRHVVTQPDKLSRLPAEGLRAVIGVGGAGAVGAECISWAEIDRSDPAPPAAATEQDLAYIMMTSGSTGRPKGLMHTHYSGLSYVRLSAATYDVRPDDRLGNHSPLHFDMSTFEYLTGPNCGSTTVIVPEEVMMFPRSAAALVERERLTFWYSVPLALIQLLEHGGLEEIDGSSLRWILFGGEPFAPKHVRRLMGLWPQARFSNVYGPAEVNQCTYYHVPEPPPDDAPIPLGRVWANSDGLVLDADDRPVSEGGTGELLIRTPTMMAGYWNRPDVEALAFYRHETVPGFPQRFYRTGDLVSVGRDGQLVYLGRKDRQVKIRGYRVELDEIEAVLARHPSLVEAAVVAPSGPDGTRRILAAAIPQAECPAPADDILAHAATQLPPYAVPETLRLQPALPRTGSGKVDRTAVARELEQADGFPADGGIAACENGSNGTGA